MQRKGMFNAVETMRDNLIFEIGLSVMALGQERTILVADERVRFIDDFMGIEAANINRNTFLYELVHLLKKIHVTKCAGG